jgi:hypothetical protein
MGLMGTSQLITYDALGLCKPGEAHKLVDAGDNTVSVFDVICSLSL